MKNELGVRRWVATMQTFGATINWIEPGRGGTEGQGDAVLYAPGSSEAVYLELKHWSVLKSGLFAGRLRKDQVRFLAVMSERRKPTLLVWGTEGGGGVWVLPGHRAPITVVSRVDPAKASYYGLKGEPALMRDIANRVFWQDWE